MNYNKKIAKKTTFAITQSCLQLRDILILKPLYQRDSEGRTVPTHPWATSFGYGHVQGIFPINAKQARHIVTHFGEIEDDDPTLTRRNRRIIEPKVQVWMSAMERGIWKPTNQGLLFEEGGPLLDGRNRLEALARLGEKIAPDNMESVEVEFTISFGVSQDVQDVVDKGSPRTIAQTAVINGLIEAKDSNGRYALKLLEGLLQKTPNGNQFKSALGSEDKVFELWTREIGETGQTYEQAARWLVDLCQTSAYPLHRGHQVPLLQYYLTNPTEAQRFIEYVVADVDALLLFQQSGIDTTFSSDELSAVGKCRQYLKKLLQAKKLVGPSGGSAQKRHYGNMLYFIHQFNKGEATKSNLSRTLCAEEEYNKATGKTFFSWHLVTD